MADLIMMKVATGFVVADAAGEAILSRIANGSHLLVTERRPRNIDWLRKYMLLIDRLFACGLETRFLNPTVLRKSLLVAAGYFEPQINLRTGEITPVAQSMALEKMDQGTFAECWDKTVDIVLSEIVPLLDHEAFGPEITAMLDLIEFERRAA